MAAVIFALAIAGAIAWTFSGSEPFGCPVGGFAAADLRRALGTTEAPNRAVDELALLPTTGLLAQQPVPEFSDQALSCQDLPKGLWRRLRRYSQGRPHTLLVSGRTYYRDRRYPAEPIDLHFLADPAGYCRRFPYRYPCTVRSVRFNIPG